MAAGVSFGQVADDVAAFVHDFVGGLIVEERELLLPPEVLSFVSEAGGTTRSGFDEHVDVKRANSFEDEHAERAAVVQVKRWERRGWPLQIGLQGGVLIKATTAGAKRGVRAGVVGWEGGAVADDEGTTGEADEGGEGARANRGVHAGADAVALRLLILAEAHVILLQRRGCRSRGIG